MVGSACWRAFSRSGYSNLIGKTSKELDLRNQTQVHDFLLKTKPDVIIDAAARVGGILANDSFPYEFLMDNMLIQNNLIRSAHELNIPKLIFLGSSCIYPKFANQPIKEDYMLTGSLEPTNKWYATAKISGVLLIESLRKQYNRDYLALMPTNLYGPNDNFDPKTSHVLPGMIRKFSDAKRNNLKEVLLWGSGKPLREFLHVDDLAESVVFLLNKKSEYSLINIGTGSDITIKELANQIKEVVGFNGEIIWDSNKPDGVQRKLLNIERIANLGWKPRIDLRNGIKSTYEWYTRYYESNLKGIDITPPSGKLDKPPKY